MPASNSLSGKIDALSGSFEDHVKENLGAHNAIMAEMGSVSKAMESHLEEEEKLRKALFGNGEVGLAEELRNITRFQNTIKRFLWILVPTSVLGVASLIWSAVFTYLRSST